VFGQQGTDRVAELEFTVLLYDQSGTKTTGFKAPLRVIAPNVAIDGRHGIRYELSTPLKPGLYQVRVTSRDQRSGVTGAADGWVEIPQASRQAEMSALFLGEARTLVKETEKALERSIDHRFAGNSLLQVAGFIYNIEAGKASKQPIGIRGDILRASKQYATMTGTVIDQPGGDPRQVPFTGKMSLEGLAPGQYELRVTVTGAGDKPLVRRTYFEVL